MKQQISRLSPHQNAKVAAVLAAVPGPTEVEAAYLSDGLGRVLAEPVVSTTALPSGRSWATAPGTVMLTGSGAGVGVGVGSW